MNSEIENYKNELYDKDIEISKEKKLTEEKIEDVREEYRKEIQ